MNTTSIWFIKNCFYCDIYVRWILSSRFLSPLLWVLGPVWVYVLGIASSCPWMLHFPSIIFSKITSLFSFHCFCFLICVCWCMYVVVGCMGPSAYIQRPEYSLPQSLSASTFETEKKLAILATLVCILSQSWGSGTTWLFQLWHSCWAFELEFSSIHS